MYKTVALLLAFPLATGQLWAQQSSTHTRDTTAIKNRVLNTVIITAGGIQQQIKGMDATIQVLERKQLEEAGIKSLDQAMARVAGAVSQDEDGRGLKPNYSLRGLDPERSSSVLTLVDGKIPSGTMYYGDPGGYYMMPLNQVERIEVIKGGATAVLFGGYTIGGVVNLVTRKAPFNPETRVELGYSSWNEFTAQVNTGARKGKFDYWINGYHRQGDGPREDRSQFNVNNVTARIGIQADSTTRLSVYLDGYTENSQTPGGLTQQQFEQNPRQVQNPYDDFISKRFSAHISLDKQLSKYDQLSIAAYGNYFIRDWYLSRKGATGKYTDVTGYIRDLPAAGTVADYKLSRPLGNHENLFIAGTRLHTDRYNNGTMKGFSPGAHIGQMTGFKATSTFSTELYVYDKFHITGPFSLSGGLRYSDINYKENNYTIQNPDKSIGRSDRTNVQAWVYSLGANYTFSDRAEVFTSLSRGFQPPLIYDVLDAGTIDKGITLKPQYSMNYEIGTRISPVKWLQLQLSAYYLNFKDKIIYDGNAGVSKNIAASEHKGIEAELQTSEWKGFSAFITATYQEAKISKGDNKGNYLRYAPTQLLATGLQYRRTIANGTFNTNLSYNYVGKQYTDENNSNIASADGNTGPVPAYHYANLHVNYERTRWGIRLGVNNLTDEKYFNRRWDFWGGIMPAPGRNFQSSVFVKF
ncbi:outer membrane receptor for Fe3+-dicitrate [Chitinophaga niastensis]|uniref:Outer membrane receptor for Fe3+-dicitrate n=1 Tax=Chitinophaga niastensis TaxID=536980 RepID=A0A2P8HSD3_CHINA|nr:TonB-dependent receptor [Chitinophaga niastensis]PSL49136.1 outer membrane receptor for Fe3+-dicitrate [Chitinophaga niastensis]